MFNLIEHIVKLIMEKKEIKNYHAYMTMCPIIILTLTPYRQTFRPIIKMYTKVF